MIDNVQSTLSQIKSQNPLILCLTNYVTMDFVANSLLAVGAAPLMSESKNEIKELVTISNAVYLNIGTLDEAYMERALRAAEVASALNKPIILDPVGSGASTLRTTNALKLLDSANVVRGNASEILALCRADSTTKGVESLHAVAEATDQAKALAKNLNKIIVISGPTDYITDGERELSLSFGSSLMPLVTGMGCTLTAVVSAFAAIHSDWFTAASQATAFFSLCGQHANQSAQSPGSFRQEFIDNLYHPNWDYFASAYHHQGTQNAI